MDFEFMETLQQAGMPCKTRAWVSGSEPLSPGASAYLAVETRAERFAAENTDPLRTDMALHMHKTI
jgi:hypothetical protein